MYTPSFLLWVVGVDSWHCGFAGEGVVAGWVLIRKGGRRAEVGAVGCVLHGQTWDCCVICRARGVVREVLMVG